VQVPVISHPPVNLKNLIPIPGFFGSPHNLIAKAFDNVSNKGFFSQVSSIDVNPLIEQSSQSLHATQSVQVGVQVVCGGKGLQVGVGLGIGVGVGVAGIIVPQV
jgi:hypothetical protein